MAKIAKIIILLVAALIVGSLLRSFMYPVFVEGSSATAPKPDPVIVKDTASLQTIVTTTSSKYGSNVALVISDLGNGATASYNANTQFVTASVYKLYVAYGVYQQIDAGKYSLSDTVSVNDSTETIDQCLDKMLTISDNDCGVALGELYGWKNLDTMLLKAGYTHTIMNNYDASGAVNSEKQTTANDVAKLLTRLYGGQLVSEDSTTSFINYLKNDEISYMLPSGFPEGTVIAHKVGYLDDYQNDAGIVYGTNKNVLVVMLTKGWQTDPTSEASAAFSNLGAAVWSYMGES